MKPGQRRFVVQESQDPSWATKQMLSSRDPEWRSPVLGGTGLANWQARKTVFAAYYIVALTKIREPLSSFTSLPLEVITPCGPSCMPFIPNTPCD